MTLVGETLAVNSQRAAIYKLLDPATGTHAVTANFSGTPYTIAGGAWSFTGVNQTTPTGIFAGNESLNDSAMVQVATVSGDTCIAVFFANAGHFASPPVPGSGQTLDWVRLPDGGTCGVRGSASGSSLLLNVSLNGAHNFTAAGVAIKKN
jgi:hypothetical protein